jgi:hypothetical protein
MGGAASGWTLSTLLGFVGLDQRLLLLKFPGGYSPCPGQGPMCSISFTVDMLHGYRERKMD